MMTATQQSDLPGGLRVLLVEDEMLLAMSFEDMLAELGCEVIGPIGRVAEAVVLAGSERLDGALLDVNVGGVEIYPVARELADRGIPFVFISGYTAQNLPPEWSNRPTLQKPFQSSDLARSMASVFTAHRTHRNFGE